MTFAEILDALPTLNPEQRDEVRWHLDLLGRMADPAFIDEITRLNDEMDKGGGITKSQLETLLAERARRAA